MGFESRWPEQGRELRWCEEHDEPVVYYKGDPNDATPFICRWMMVVETSDASDCRIGPVPHNILASLPFVREVAEVAFEEGGDLRHEYELLCSKGWTEQDRQNYRDAVRAALDRVLAAVAPSSEGHPLHEWERSMLPPRPGFEHRRPRTVGDGMVGDWDGGTKPDPGEDSSE
jgi:hypothetical protein